VQEEQKVALQNGASAVFTGAKLTNLISSYEIQTAVLNDFERLGIKNNPERFQ
jgi:hypothetical protein